MKNLKVVNQDELKDWAENLFKKKWACPDLNRGPHDYQSCAPTNYATRPYLLEHIFDIAHH